MVITSRDTQSSGIVAYNKLLESLRSGVFTPGDRLREEEVSEALGLSRTPVREALARLASESFLERIPHRGFRLPEENVTDLIELYPIITALEVLATLEALDLLDAEALEELREVKGSYEVAYKSNDVYAGIERNHEFHDLLSKRSGNQRLCRMLGELRSKVRSLEIWAFSDISHWPKSIEEHETILRAIERGNHNKALEILERNRLTTYREFIKRAEVEAESD